MEQGSDLALELNTTQYNVNRISRLVNMYHAFHHTTGHEERYQQEERGPLPSRSFLCPKCQKRTWRTIETYRVHKSHCKKELSGGGARRGVKEEEVHHCGDCGAGFKTSAEYREHVRGRTDTGQQHTWVCPYHCGNGNIIMTILILYTFGLYQHSLKTPVFNTTPWSASQGRPWDRSM